jgi:hypothetical protein
MDNECEFLFGIKSWDKSSTCGKLPLWNEQMAWDALRTLNVKELNHSNVTFMG